MSTEKFDEILDQCLTMMQAGASIDDCVAPYPQHADELRAQLQTAQTLWDAEPTAQHGQAAQASGRRRLLTTVAEMREASPATPLLGAPLRALFGGVRRLTLLPTTLLVAGAILLMSLTGLTAAAAVLQPDVPLLREIFGDGSSSSREANSGSSESSSDEPRSLFKDGECELRGPISDIGVDTLVINGFIIDTSSAEEMRGDLALAMADGTQVRVKGDIVDGSCVAREIKVHDDDEDQDADEIRTEIEDGECELRGSLTSLVLDPLTLVINGLTIDGSSADRVRGDLAQALIDGTQVRVKGDIVDGICIAREIEVHDDEDDQDADEIRTEIEDGECELRGSLTSLVLDPLALVINGITIDGSSAEDVRGDLAQALADGTQVRVKGDFVDGSCVAREIEVHEDDEDPDGDEPRTEIEDGECELRGSITSLDPLVINGITIDGSSAEDVRGDLAQALADGAEVRVKGDIVDGSCIAREIRVHDDD